jgi:hypothetical protein
MKLQPYDFPEAKPNRMKAFFDGDSVPKPLGFSAFSPEWLLSLRRLAPPRHSGRWIGARVASLRCPILRPGGASINRVTSRTKILEKLLPKLLPVR